MINDVNECIDLINRLNELDDIKKQDIDELLVRITPFLTKRYGNQLPVQIEKLCRARNFDRAVKLLNSLPKSRLFSPAGRRMTMTAMMVLIAGISVLVALLNSNQEGENYTDDNYSESTDEWISTDAVVINSRVGSHISDKTGSSEDYPYIQYTYEVNGNKYTSDSVSYSGSDPTGIVEDYPEGEKITVYYNASNPAQAVLELESYGIGFIFVISSILMVFFFIYFFRKRKA